MSSESKPKLGAGFSQGDLQHMAMIYLVLVTLPFIAVVLLSSLTECVAKLKQRERSFMQNLTHKATKSNLASHKVLTPKEASIRDTLVAVKNTAIRLRCRIQGTIMLVGWAFFALGIMPHVMYFAELVLDEPFYSYLAALAPSAMALLLLALRPIDAFLVAIVSYLFFAVFVMTALFFLAVPNWNWGEDAVSTAFYVGIICLNGAGAVILAPSVVYCAGAVPTRRKLQRLWLVYRLFVGGVGLSHFVLAIVYKLYAAATPTVATSHCTIAGCIRNETVTVDPMRVEGDTIMATMVIGVIFLLGALVWTPSCRARVLRQVGFVGKYKSPYQTAAAIAAHLNSRASVVEAIMVAQRMFRVLPLHQLTVADFAPSTTLADVGRTVASLSSRTQAAELGRCDAFVSHSWHDDASRKHAKLNALTWNTAEPTIWLDKVRAKPPCLIISCLRWAHHPVTASCI